VRKIFDIKNSHHTKKVLHRKLLINFIVIFFIFELLLNPFSAASFTSSDGLDGDTKTTDSGGSPPAVGDLPSDSGSGMVVNDNTSTDTNSDSSVVDDTNTDSSNDVDDTPTDTNSDSSVVDDTNTDSSNDMDDGSTDSSSANLTVEESSTNSSGKSLFYDDFYYAPNERIVSTDEIVSKTENSIGDLMSGVEKEIQIESFEDINSVKLTPSIDLEGVKVTIIKLKDKPEEIIDPPKKNTSVYKYLDIKLSTNDTFVDEEEINSLEFNFKVEKTWIAYNEIDIATVKLIRYHDGVWQNLSTTLNSENDTCIFYTAASPGFSTFAVVGSKVVEKSESYGTDDISIPWSIIIAFIMTLTIMLVFILFKARYIYLKDDSK
jgi:PGF-pre-PGF domain-containing protein